MARIAALGFAVLTLAALLGFAPPANPPVEAPTPSTAPTDDASLVVMSFNIRYGTASDGDNAWPKRRQMVIDRIRASEADIVGLQEALKFQIDELLAAMPEYRFVGVGRDDGLTGGEYCAILYRHTDLHIQPPLPPAKGTPPAHGDFWYSETPGIRGSKSWGNRITRICSWARFVRTGTEHSFYVFNTHLDHESQPSREKSALLLKEQIARRGGTDPVIVTGDFNACESNPAITTMLRPDKPTDGKSPNCPPLRDSFRVIHPDEREVGTFNSFKSKPPFNSDKIDYIFIDDRWEVLAASIDRTMPDGRCPSDHFPVIARLRFKPAPAKAPASNPISPSAPKP